MPEITHGEREQQIQRLRSVNMLLLPTAMRVFDRSLEYPLDSASGWLRILRNLTAVTVLLVGSLVIDFPLAGVTVAKRDIENRARGKDAQENSSLLR